MEVPEPVTVPDVKDPQVRPEGMVSVRVTVPANPLMAVIVRLQHSLRLGKSRRC
jgi:hypothetical protein